MNRIKHIEIAGADGEKLEGFYSQLLGWRINRKDVGGYPYGEIDTGGEPTAGIRHEPNGKAEVVIYVEVADVDSVVEKARRLGATVRIPPMQYGDLRFALLEDPEGNPLGLTQPPSGQGT